MALSSLDWQTLYVQALVLLRDARPAEAADKLRRLLADDPSHSRARGNLIRALIGAGSFADVIVETTSFGHDDPEMLYHRGSAFSALSQPEAARDTLMGAVARDPAHAAAWLNLGNVFVDLDDLDQGAAHCRQAMALDPRLIEARVSLGFILTEQGHLTEARAVLEAAIKLAPDNVHAHWNLATAALLAGDLTRGFAEYEWRKRHDRFRRDFIDLPGPVWSGDDPSGRTILVHAEQGLGDTIQFARFLPILASRGGTPILACEPALIPLLETIPGVRALPKSGPLPDYDAWIDQMSLPLVFGTTLESIPGAQGYIPVRPGLRQPGPRVIGLAWRGNPLHSNDRHRTPPEDIFAPLLASSRHRFVSLVPNAVLPGVEPALIALTDYAATASVIAGLDLVISVDTSIAHLAGAMGRPAWVLLPFAPDWRWLLNRTDTPWYRSLRLFRQPARGAWPAVIANIAAALAEREKFGWTGGNQAWEAANG